MEWDDEPRKKKQEGGEIPVLWHGNEDVTVTRTTNLAGRFTFCGTECCCEVVAAT